MKCLLLAFHSSRHRRLCRATAPHSDTNIHTTEKHFPQMDFRSKVFASIEMIFTSGTLVSTAPVKQIFHEQSKQGKYYGICLNHPKTFNRKCFHMALSMQPIMGMANF